MQGMQFELEAQLKCSCKWSTDIPKLSRRGIVEPFDLIARLRAGMALMAALNLAFALLIFSRHCGTPADATVYCIYMLLPCFSD